MKEKEKSRFIFSLFRFNGSISINLPHPPALQCLDYMLPWHIINIPWPRFNGAKAGLTDITSGNGVTHVVESLVIPKSARYLSK